MIGYATLGTNDPARAKAFYDALMAEAGARRLMEMPDARELTFWGAARNRPMLAVGRPYDGGAATPGNGAMVALSMDSRAQVDRLHARLVVEGPNFRFGHRAAGDVAVLTELGATYDYEVEVVDLVVRGAAGGGVPFSSTLTRRLVAEGVVVPQGPLHLVYNPWYRLLPR